MGYTSGVIAIPTDGDGDGWSSCLFSIERLADGRFEVQIDGRVAFHMPDARNPVEAIRRAATHSADDQEYQHSDRNGGQGPRSTETIRFGERVYAYLRAQPPLDKAPERQIPVDNPVSGSTADREHAVA